MSSIVQSLPPHQETLGPYFYDYRHQPGRRGSNETIERPGDAMRTNGPVYLDDLPQKNPPKWHWRGMISSVVVSALCCPVVGFLGALFMALAYIDHKNGDYEGSEFKKKCAWRWIIGGLILGVLLIAIIIINVYLVSSGTTI